MRRRKVGRAFFAGYFEVIMNLYDLTQYDPALYVFDPFALRQIARDRGRRTLLGFFFAASVAVLLLALAIPLRGTQAAYFWFFGGCAVLWACGAATAGVAFWQHFSWLRTVEADPAAAHDYAYFLYVHGRLHNRLLQSTAFLAMASSSLRLGHIPQAEQALYGVDPACLLRSSRPLRQYLCCVFALANAQEEAFSEGYAALQAMPLYGQTAPERAAWLQALQNRELSACCAALNHRTYQNSRRVFYKGWSASAYVWALFVVLDTAAQSLLPDALSFRVWFSLGGRLIGWCGACALLLVLFSYGFCVLAASAAGAAKADFLRAGGTLLTLLACGALLAGGWWIQRSTDSETRQADGTLLVVPNSYRGGSTDSWEAVGPFFRCPVVSAPETQPDVPDSEPDADRAVSAAEAAVHNGYTALLSSYFPGDAATAQFAVSAKGDAYVIVQENDSSRVRLVFDRTSANGACLLYVCYQDTLAADAHGGVSASDTAILNFYAYNPVTGETIAADKTSWDAAGSDAYRTATGE